MDVAAENMFDEIAKRYEAAFSEDPSLQQIIDRSLGLLKPNSSILDLGCGTGKPVCYQLAAAGHNVTGIDISQEMLEIAKRQVNGEFLKADMTKYTPAPTQQFDAIFTIFSLFNSSYEQIHSLMFKFREWLTPGGRLIIATIPSDCMFDDKSLYNESGKWVDTKPMYFMGHEFPGSAATVEGWRELLGVAGFEIESELNYKFSPPDDTAHKADPDHHYFVARRGEQS